ncbi:MAG: hypothetical protein KAS92_00710 [Candidatus Omnitrophica bacterium]|nr:hypothetical protein [Candidatus Omnitrophota bacterium]
MDLKKIKWKDLFKYVFAFIFASTFLMQFNAILHRSNGEIKRFLRAKGDYTEVRNSYTTFAVTTEAKRIIPPESPVGISHTSSGIENIAARYNLYPLKLREPWAYFIDLNHSVKNQESLPRRKKLSSGVFIYTNEGIPFLTGKNMPDAPSLPKKLLIFLSTVIFQTILGMLVLCLLKIPRKTTETFWLATTGYLIGFCIFTASLWIVLLLEFALDISTVIVLGIILMCSLLYLSSDSHVCANKPDAPKEVKRPLTKMLIVFTAFLVGIITLWIVSNPVKDWDTMSNWAIKSKVMFHEQSLNLQYTSDNHNYYPILWPLHIAAEFVLLKGDYDEVALWSSALFFLILLSQLLKGFSLMGAKPLFANVCLLGYIAYFASQNPTISALPENAFLCFLTGLLVSLCLWLKSPHDKHYLVISIILAIGLSLIKLEGAVATMIIVFSLIIAKRQAILNGTAKPFLLTLLLTAILPSLWIYWIRSQGFSGGIVHLQGSISPQKLILLAQSNINQFVKHGEGLLLFFGLAYFVFFPNLRKWNAAEKFLLIVSVLLMIFKWMATAGWSEEMILAPGVFNDTAWRLFLHAGPSLILLFCSRAFDQAQA